MVDLVSLEERLIEARRNVAAFRAGIIEALDWDDIAVLDDALTAALSQPEGPPAMGVEEVAKQGAWLILRNRIGPAYADRSQAAQSPEWHNAVRDARAILTISPQPVPARGEEGAG